MYVLYQDGVIRKRQWPAPDKMLAEFQKAVGGPIEMVGSRSIPEGIVCLVREDGFRLGLECTTVALEDGTILRGPVILCSLNEAGDDFGPIPDDLAKILEVAIFPGEPPKFRVALDGELRAWG